MKYIIIIVLLMGLSTLAFGQFSLDLETGLAISGYNDLRIPNDEISSDLSFTSELESPIVWASRANLHFQITPRHELSLLYAPLTIKPKGTVDRDINFMGDTFAQGEEIQGTYRFDSYRLQYLYRFKNQKMLIRALGLSLKVRDAEISLENEDTFATKTNTGLVPLIGFEFAYDLTDEFELMLKGEALGSPFGRAEDILLAASYEINENYDLYAGYRLLEGGSDVDEVYTFALINYAMLGVKIRF